LGYIGSLNILESLILKNGRSPTLCW